MSLNAIREGVATRLATISGLRAFGEIPDQPNPPVAIVSVRSIDFDQAFARGLVIYNLVVTVIVGRVAERTAQMRLDAYCASTGADSVKVAIEGDKTLGGTAYDVKVTSLNNIGALQLNGEVNYLAAEFSVTVYAA